MGEGSKVLPREIFSFGVDHWSCASSNGGNTSSLVKGPERSTVPLGAKGRGE
jgi:hypothetical protein